MSRTDDQFALRFPGDMRDRIKADAAKNHRSMNAEILFRLGEYERRKAIWEAMKDVGFGGKIDADDLAWAQGASNGVGK